MQTRHLTGPGELIAAIAFILGSVPRESVVAVGLGGTGEVVVAMRVARRDAVVAESAASLGRAVAAKLRASAARRAFLVSFTEDDVSVACPAVDAMRHEIVAAVDRLDVWACDGERYWSPGCADPACCPVGGREVPWSALAPAASMTASAVAHAAPEEDDVPAPATRRRSAARAADRWWEQRAADVRQWRCEAWARCSESYPIGAPAPAIGRALASVGDVRVRDALIVEWLGGDSCAVLDTLYGRDSAAVGNVLDGAMRDPECEPPDPAEVVASLRWCRRLLAHARRREQAPVLALSAVLLWWSGDQAAALRAAEASLRCDPCYSLARLVRDVADAGISPAWTGRGNGYLDTDVIL